MGWATRYAYELYLVFTLFVCAVAGGYVGGRLALRDCAQPAVVQVDPQLGPTFGQPEPSLVVSPRREEAMPTYTL